MRVQKDENSDLNTDETELELDCGGKKSYGPCTLIVLFLNNFESRNMLIIKNRASYI
jgi:hypothetical protein